VKYQPPFISDMVTSLELVTDNGSTMKIGRYGVWVYYVARGKYQVEETSDDLDYLQKKYGPGLPVEPVKPKS
jgi:hypothetical protein